MLDGAGLAGVADGDLGDVAVGVGIEDLAEGGDVVLGRIEAEIHRHGRRVLVELLELRHRACRLDLGRVGLILLRAEMGSPRRHRAGARDPQAPVGREVDGLGVDRGEHAVVGLLDLGHVDRGRPGLEMRHDIELAVLLQDRGEVGRRRDHGRIVLADDRLPMHVEDLPEHASTDRLPGPQQGPVADRRLGTVHGHRGAGRHRPLGGIVGRSRGRREHQRILGVAGCDVHGQDGQHGRGGQQCATCHLRPSDNIREAPPKAPLRPM